MFLFSRMLTTLGLSLLSSMWQMALTWSFYYILTDRHKRFSAAIRHDLLLTLCMINTFWFLYCLVSFYNHPTFSFFTVFSSSSVVQYFLPFVTAFYLVVLVSKTAYCCLQLIGHSRRIDKKLVKSDLWQAYVKRQSSLLGIGKTVRLFFSEKIKTAVTIGYFKPLILIPASLITRFSTYELEAIILHELLHIRRNDFLINLLLTLYCNVFFFNPFARQFYQSICRERELACDDGVLERNICPKLYAEALFQLECQRQELSSLIIAVDGHSPKFLRDRIARLLGIPKKKQIPFRLMPFAGVLLAIALLIPSFQSIHQKGELKYVTKTLAVFPAIYSMNEDKLNLSVVVNRVVNVENRPHKKKSLYPIKSNTDNIFRKIEYTIYRGDPVTEVSTQFANISEFRNFSNEQNSMTVESQKKDNIITPYLPENVFQYNQGISGEQADSLNEKRIKEIVVFTIIQKNVLKYQLVKAQNNVNIELKKIENRRNIYKHLNDKKFKVLVDKLQEQVDKKQLEMDKINIQSQALDDEIIHI